MVQYGGTFSVVDDIALTGTLTTTGSVTSSGTAGVGYSAGAGGTVTQLTSKSTAVTLNKITGAITMNNAALNTVTGVSFACSNSTVAATDAVVLNHASGGTAGSYLVSVGAVGAGTFTATVYNHTGGNLSEAIVLRFAVIKGVSV